MKPQRVSHIPDSGADRRRLPRQATVMRVATIKDRAGKELCIVRNVSSAGLQARAYRHRRPGDVIDIEFKEGQVIKGTIVWARDYRIGVQFHAETDLHDLLSSRWTGETAVLRPRPLRLEVDCPAILRVGSQVLATRVRDLSQAGAKLLVGQVLEHRDAVLALPGLPRLVGVIRWQSKELAGMAFNETLDVEALANWIGNRRPGGQFDPMLLQPPELSQAARVGVE